MNTTSPNTGGYEFWMRGILRIVAALLFMQHGTQKLFAFPTDKADAAPVALGSLMGVAGILETFGGLLLLLGLFARPVAFILAGQMAVAYFMRHAPEGFWPVLNQGELAALYCFVFLYFVAAGAGALSLDAWRARRRLGAHHIDRPHAMPPSMAPGRRAGTRATSTSR